MADSDKTLKLLIELGVIGKEDAEAANKLLEESKAATGGLSKEMGVLNVTSADVTKALDKTGEGAEMSRMSMRRLAHAMGSEVPGGAALMEAGFSAAEGGMMSSTFLLIAGIEMLKSAIEKINKETEQSRKLSEALADADRATNKIIDAQRTALEQADVAQAEFFHNYIHNAHDAFDAETKLYEARLKASFEAADRTETAKKRASESAIDELEQRGVLSHAAALRAKETLDIEYENRKLQRKVAQDLADEAELIRQKANKDIAARNDIPAEQAAEKRYESAVSAKAKNDAALAEAEEKKDAAKEVIKGLQGAGINDATLQSVRDLYEQATKDKSGSKSLSEMFSSLADVNLAGGGAASLSPTVRAIHTLISQLGSRGDVNLGLYDSAQKDLTLQNINESRAKKHQTGIDIDEGNAKSDLEDARRKAEKDREDARALGDKISITRPTNQMAEGGMAISNAENTPWGQTILAMAAATGKNNQQIQNLFEGLLNHTLNLGTVLAQMRAQLNQLESQFGHSQNTQGGQG